MIHAGQTIENPATGELLTFHTTARETGGEYTLFEARILPDGTLPAAHFHPRQTERFEILSGTLTMKVGREKFEARPGDVVVIEPGVPHHFRNNTAEDVRFRSRKSTSTSSSCRSSPWRCSGLGSPSLRRSGGSSATRTPISAPPARRP
jgi:mannose-6-phosphate isomerase-like protein (cupin superfamily)